MNELFHGEICSRQTTEELKEYYNKIIHNFENELNDNSKAAEYLFLKNLNQRVQLEIENLYLNQNFQYFYEQYQQFLFDF